MLSFGCLMSVKLIGKGLYCVLINSLHQYFKLVCINCLKPTVYYRLYMAFISHIKAVYSKKNFAHMGVERQTTVQTYIYTHTLFRNQFQ